MEPSAKTAAKKRRARPKPEYVPDDPLLTAAEAAAERGQAIKDLSGAMCVPVTCRRQLPIAALPRSPLAHPRWIGGNRDSQAGHVGLGARSMSAIPFEQIQSASLAQADRLLRDWFPAGKRVGKEFLVGNIHGDAGVLRRSISKRASGLTSPVQIAATI